MATPYQVPPGGASYPHVSTSSMALISLIAGLLGLTFFPLVGSVVAVITGPMAKKEILQSGGALTGAELATAGQILGWIGIAFGAMGLCLAALAIAVPLCLIPWGVFSSNYWLVPSLLGFLF